eukprot:SAG25_NODE_2017_length_2021_cov_14.509365_2_plen_229_part_00
MATNNVRDDIQLGDHVLSLLSKSKVDAARTWASIDADESEIQKINQVFSLLVNYQKNTLHESTKLRKFGAHFPKDFHPALYSWLTSSISNHELRGALRRDNNDDDHDDAEDGKDVNWLWKKHKIPFGSISNAEILGALSLALGALALGLTIWNANTGCCQQVQTSWETDGIQSSSCAQHRGRDATCTVSCLSGFNKIFQDIEIQKDASLMQYRCSMDSGRPEWVPANS